MNKVLGFTFDSTASFAFSPTLRQRLLRPGFNCCGKIGLHHYLQPIVGCRWLFSALFVRLANQLCEQMPQPLLVRVLAKPTAHLTQQPLELLGLERPLQTKQECRKTAAPRQTFAGF